MTKDNKSEQFLRTVLFVGIFTVVATSCAAGDARFSADDPAGFWQGIWHGLIACITLIVGLFYDGVEIYERNNTGGWYDFGFLIGVGLLSGSGHKSHKSWSTRKRKRMEGIPKSGKAKVTLDVSWGDDDEQDEGDGDDGDGKPRLKKEIE